MQQILHRTFGYVDLCQLIKAYVVGRSTGKWGRGAGGTKRVVSA